jgi:hypothetical protein
MVLFQGYISHMSWKPWVQLLAWLVNVCFTGKVVRTPSASRVVLAAPNQTLVLMYPHGISGTFDRITVIEGLYAVGVGIEGVGFSFVGQRTLLACIEFLHPLLSQLHCEGGCHHNTVNLGADWKWAVQVSLQSLALTDNFDPHCPLMPVCTHLFCPS